MKERHYDCIEAIEITKAMLMDYNHPIIYGPLANDVDNTVYCYGMNLEELIVIRGNRNEGWHVKVGTMDNIYVGESRIVVKTKPCKRNPNPMEIVIESSDEPKRYTFKIFVQQFLIQDQFSYTKYSVHKDTYKGSHPD